MSVDLCSGKLGVSASFIAYPHDRLPACRERLAERGHGFAAFKAALDLGALVCCKARRPSDGLALRPRAASPGLGAFDQQVALEFGRSEEHTSELQSLMRISYAVFCLKKQKKNTK